MIVPVHRNDDSKKSTYYGHFTTLLFLSLHPPRLFQQSPQLITIDKPRQGADREQAQRHDVKLPILDMDRTGHLVLEPEPHADDQAIQQAPLNQPQPKRLRPPIRAGEDQQPTLTQPRQVGGDHRQPQPQANQDSWHGR